MSAPDMLSQVETAVLQRILSSGDPALGSPPGPAGPTDGAHFVASDMVHFLTGDVGAMLTETPAEDETDWTAGNVEADAFVITPDVADALAEPVSDSTLPPIAVEADRLEARREALPEFLQTPMGQRLIPNATFQEMQEMKAREVEQVR